MPPTARSPSRDVDGAVGAVLAIDSQIHEWAADTLDSDEQDRARETLRRYVVRLGDLARNGAADPRDLIGPVVDRILEPARARCAGRGSTRSPTSCATLLVDAGIEVHDTPAGSTWELVATPTRLTRQPVRRSPHPRFAIEHPSRAGGRASIPDRR